MQKKFYRVVNVKRSSEKGKEHFALHFPPLPATKVEPG